MIETEMNCLKVFYRAALKIKGFLEWFLREALIWIKCVQYGLLELLHDRHLMQAT